MLTRRPARTPVDDAALGLLSDLLAAPPESAQLRPVALRSLKAQRRDVLAPYPLRTWIDRALTIGERLLGLAVLVFFCWWLIDGYGRDWWHARNAAPTPTVTQFRRVAAAPLATSTAAPPQPSFGSSLPVVDDRWSQPRVAFDYLAPARSYVKPLQPAPTPAPVAQPPRDMRPTHLTLPAAGVDSSVVEVFVQDGAWQVADYAVGYHHGTGIVGRSNMVLAAHKGLRGGIFRNLDQVKPGDALVVEAAGERFEYRVRTTKSVWPSQIDVMFATEQPQITLLTCTNWDTQRLVVVADFVGAITPPAVGGN